MRKVSLSVALLLLFLTGCSNSDVPRIEHYDWIMTSVQSMEEDGQVIAYGERGSSTLDTAKQIELICMAENGDLMLTDQTNHKIYTGTYELSKTDFQSSVYEVAVNGKKGIAIVTLTTYQDGSQEPTFIVTLGEKAIKFFAK